MNAAIREALGLGKFSFRAYKIHSAQSFADANKKGLDLLEYRESLLAKKLSSSRLKFLTGHSRCTPETRAAFDQKWDFVTLLRNPVDRWISNYFFNHNKKSPHFKTDLDINDYLVSPEGQEHGSTYVRYFSNSSIEDVNESHLMEAIENLSHFKVVSTLEAIGDFQSKMKTELGLDLNIEVKNQNPVSNSKIQDKVSPDLLEQIKATCSLDLKLFELVQERFIQK